MTTSTLESTAQPCWARQYLQNSNVDGVGAYRLDDRGAIFWHPYIGAYEVHGAILEKWSETGLEHGWLGYPVTDESPARAGGRFNHFSNGSIYWKAEFGAHPVPGPIFDKWATMGWESSIGFPTADPADLGRGEVTQRFEKAIMSWGCLLTTGGPSYLQSLL